MKDLTNQHRPSFSEAFWFWLKLGFISFGGPSGQISLIHEELVAKRQWISEFQFIRALNFCMLLPGPEAHQLSIYIGWLLHGIRGGIIAGVFFVIPSVLILGALSWLYVLYGNVTWVIALFVGIKPVVVAIVATSVARLGRKAFRSNLLWMVGGISFFSLFGFGISFPWVILGAAVIGWIGGRFAPTQFTLGDSPKEQSPDSLHSSHKRSQTILGFGSHARRVLIMGLSIWWGPVILLTAWLGKDHSVVQEAVFFSKAAVVTFGGAYAVLPYVSQQAVESHHWLSASQMMDGLGLAEITPGPLIIVLQFVGFLGAYANPGGLAPSISGFLGALATSWTTFVPSFIFIFLGAPWVERLQGQPRLNAALSAVTAAVVGVILNLGIWFGWQVFYSAHHGVHWFSLGVAVLAYISLTHLKMNLLKVIGTGMILGLVNSYFL